MTVDTKPSGGRSIGLTMTRRDASCAWRWTLAWVVLWVLAVLLGNRIPPFQSPDEGQHLGRAAALAAGQWRLQSIDGGHSSGQADPALLEYQNMHDSIVTDVKGRLDTEQRQRAKALAWSGQTSLRPLPGTGYYLPVIYAPHALGLAIGQWVDLTVADSYRLARGLVLATSLFLLAWAVRIWRPPALAVAVLMLPMSLFQAVAPVIDGLSNAMTVLALSLFLAQRERLAQGLATQRHAMVALTVCVVILGSSRLHLAPLAMLPGWLAIRSRSDARKVNAGLALAAVGSIVAWTAHAVLTTVDLRIARSVSTMDVALFYLKDPLEIVAVLARTLGDPAVQTFYWTSFLGLLGWLDTRLPDVAYGWLGWALLGTASAGVAARLVAGIQTVAPAPTMDEGSAGQDSLVARGLLVLAALAGVLIVFLALLLTWSQHPAVQVQGVQGRYFIGPALVMAYALCARTTRQASPGRAVAALDVAAWSMAALAAAVSLWALWSAITLRYH